MNNLKDNFERMMQLAEYGVNRHNDRRQIEFRIFISYVPLLVLGFYQIDKFENLVKGSPEFVWGIAVLLGIM